MNNQKAIQLWIAILFAFLSLAAVRAAQTPATSASAPSSAPAPYLSTFNITPGYGKDPFFPKSTRFQINPVVKTNVVLQPGELPAGMVLKGLSGTKERPLAIINNYTFAAGEEAEVRIGIGLYRVRVVEIKERSVIVSVNGTTPRELALRQGL